MQNWIVKFSHGPSIYGNGYTNIPPIPKVGEYVATDHRMEVLNVVYTYPKNDNEALNIYVVVNQ
jgi:hypothetical protein